MNLSGLSPESHGTLQALRDLKILRFFEEAAAAELVRHGYAERAAATKLRITEKGHSVSPFARRGSAQERS